MISLLFTHAASFRNISVLRLFTRHCSAGIDGARDGPADGGNATHMDASHHKTQQKQKMGDGQMYVYMTMAEL